MIDTLYNIWNIKQAVGDECAGQAMQALEEQTCFFESALFAGDVDAHEHLSGGQDGGKTVHGSGNNYAPQCRKPWGNPDPHQKPPRRAVVVRGSSAT